MWQKRKMMQTSTRNNTKKKPIHGIRYLATMLSSICIRYVLRYLIVLYQALFPV
jgi:hypothetical protein